MTRESLLQYIAKKYGAALAQVGLTPKDTPESLFYILNDAMPLSNDDKRKADADRRVASLIHDRADMLDVVIEQPEPEAEQPPAVKDEAITDVSNL